MPNNQQYVAAAYVFDARSTRAQQGIAVRRAQAEHARSECLLKKRHREEAGNWFPDAHGLFCEQMKSRWQTNGDHRTHRNLGSARNDASGGKDDVE